MPEHFIMAESGAIRVVNVVGIDFCDEGRSLRLELIDAASPHATMLVTFGNVIAVSLFKSEAAPYPLLVVDLTWKTCAGNELQTELERLRYPFSPGHGSLGSRPLVHARLEGDITGDVFAERVNVADS